MRLPSGKLPPSLLSRFLSSLPPQPRDVVLGARLGEDAAVLDAGGPELLVAASDPITLATTGAAESLVAVNANDLAVMGAEPRWLLVTVLLPEGITDEAAAALLDELAKACARASIALVGGHTEVTAGLDRTVLCATLLGTVPRRRLRLSRDMSRGDAVLQVGAVALEGSAVLAREHAPRLLAEGVPQSVIDTASGWLDHPGISILPLARKVWEIPGVHAMHDPTEGGIATALREFAAAGEADIRVDAQAVTVLPECQTICAALGLNPLGLLASGSLLIAADQRAVPSIQKALAGAGAAVKVIGEVVSPGEGNLDALPEFETDEITRVL